MRLSAVIGANYGDEGKGRVVDALATGPSLTLVVRHNGGAQAGHTVLDSDGRRHVFHHFGSGTLAGAYTFLSRFFVVNPIIFRTEYRELRELQVTPRVFLDPDAPVTTPYDMLVNQALETRRGHLRHGSCGLGFNETVLRSSGSDYTGKLSGYELMTLSEANLRKKLRIIRDGYFQDRLKETDLEEPKLFRDEGIEDHYIEDLFFLRSACTLKEWEKTFAHSFEHIIFEGAQGLRLDQSSKDFPFVTHSHPGLPNVCHLLRSVGLHNTQLHVHYVTRPYITRHGPGPLPHELESSLDKPYPNVRDDTNLENPWQGKLRFGWFDQADFVGPIKDDLAEASVRCHKVVPHLEITCADQLGNVVYWFKDKDHLGYTPLEFFVGFLQGALTAPMARCFFGPGPDAKQVCYPSDLTREPPMVG